MKHSHDQEPLAGMIGHSGLRSAQSPPRTSEVMQGVSLAQFLMIDLAPTPLSTLFQFVERKWIKIFTWQQRHICRSTALVHPSEHEGTRRFENDVVGVLGWGVVIRRCTVNGGEK